MWETLSLYVQKSAIATYYELAAKFKNTYL